MRPEWHTSLRYRWHINPATGITLRARARGLGKNVRVLYSEKNKALV